VELEEQHFSRTREARSHRSQRTIQGRCGFLVGEILEVDEHDHDAEAFREPIQRRQDLRADDPQSFGRRVPRLRTTFGEQALISSVDLVEGELLRLTLILPVLVDLDGMQNRKQPGLRVGSRDEVVEGPVRAQTGLLDEVRCVVRAASQSQPHAMERPEVGSDERLEASPPIVLAHRAVKLACISHQG